MNDLSTPKPVMVVKPDLFPIAFLPGRPGLHPLFEPVYTRRRTLTDPVYWPPKPKDEK
ncbi:hypothetical protein [Aeromicrobium sp. 179-A 4D2 NHS]|uniref:hypothetical protein n=1 Tax=Aeromicrobium sp. 179-A 4D2 NHS TaxID=3142375 RepID=UPI0039A2C1E4